MSDYKLFTYLYGKSLGSFGERIYHRSSSTQTANEEYSSATLKSSFMDLKFEDNDDINDIKSFGYIYNPNGNSFAFRSNLRNSLKNVRNLVEIHRSTSLLEIINYIISDSFNSGEKSSVDFVNYKNYKDDAIMGPDGEEEPESLLEIDGELTESEYTIKNQVSKKQNLAQKLYLEAIRNNKQVTIFFDSEEDEPEELQKFLFDFIKLLPNSLINKYSYVTFIRKKAYKNFNISCMLTDDRDDLYEEGSTVALDYTYKTKQVIADSFMYLLSNKDQIKNYISYIKRYDAEYDKIDNVDALNDFVNRFLERDYFEFVNNNYFEAIFVDKKAALYYLVKAFSEKKPLCIYDKNAKVNFSAFYQTIDETFRKKIKINFGSRNKIDAKEENIYINFVFSDNKDDVVIDYTNPISDNSVLIYNYLDTESTLDNIKKDSIKNYVTAGKIIASLKENPNNLKDLSEANNVFETGLKGLILSMFSTDNLDEQDTLNTIIRIKDYCKKINDKALISELIAKKNGILENFDTYLKQENIATMKSVLKSLDSDEHLLVLKALVCKKNPSDEYKNLLKNLLSDFSNMSDNANLAIYKKIESQLDDNSLKFLDEVLFNHPKYACLDDILKYFFVVRNDSEKLSALDKEALKFKEAEQDDLEDHDLARSVSELIQSSNAINLKQILSQEYDARSKFQKFVSRYGDLYKFDNRIHNKGYFYRIFNFVLFVGLFSGLAFIVDAILINQGLISKSVKAFMVFMPCAIFVITLSWYITTRRVFLSRKRRDIFLQYLFVILIIALLYTAVYFVLR